MVDCRWVSGGVQIHTGPWVEKMVFHPFITIKNDKDQWKIICPQGILYVGAKPKLSIQWKNKVKRRKSIMNGEY
jgi:hypothetical protein